MLIFGFHVYKVIMRRAERKLLLSQNVVGDHFFNQDEEGKVGADAGDLRSAIFGLHMFDPSESNEESGESKMSELNDMAEKVIAMRYDKANTERKFEINPASLSANNDVAPWRSSLVSFDSDADEASYLSWIEKFKEVSKSSDQVNDELGSRRALTKPEDKQLIADEGAKKSEEKKLMKWESLGYHSLSVKEPVLHSDMDLMLDSGSVHFIYGDCTETSKVCPSQPAVIFRFLFF